MLGLFLLGLATNVTADVPTEFDLEEESFHSLLQNSKFTFAIFHGLDCGYCDHLRTVMGELSEELGPKYPDLNFALVNAEAFHNIRKKHSIEKYPVGKLFSGPTYFNFFIQRLSKEQIRAFIEETLSQKSTPVEISSDKSYVKYNNLDYALVFAVPEIGEAERSFARDVQDLFPKVPIFYVQTGSKWDSLLFKDKPESKKFRMHFKRDFDEGDKSFARKEMFDAEDLAATLRRIKDPRIALITQTHSDEIFSGLHPGLVLFDKDINSRNVAVLTKVLLEHPFHGVPLKTNGTDPYADAFLNHLGVQETDFPALRIIGVGGGKINKFKYEGDWSEKDLANFLKKFKESRLTTYLKNAAKIAPSTSKVNQWNRDQYLESLEDSENIKVVGFVAKWCAKCKAIQQLFEKTREQINDKKSFVFAVVDLDMNDIDGVDLSKAPVIQVIQGSNIREFTGEHTPEELSYHLNPLIAGEL